MKRAQGRPSHATEKVSESVITGRLCVYHYFTPLIIIKARGFTYTRESNPLTGVP